ncbi:hypothetical protein BOH78_5420, partial [Pichia kudriavzevii]
MLPKTQQSRLSPTQHQHLGLQAQPQAQPQSQTHVNVNVSANANTNTNTNTNTNANTNANANANANTNVKVQPQINFLPLPLSQPQLQSQVSVQQLQPPVSASAALGINTRHRSGTLPSSLSTNPIQQQTMTPPTSADFSLRMRSQSSLANSNALWDDQLSNASITSLDTTGNPSIHQQQQQQQYQQTRLRSYSNSNLDVPLASTPLAPSSFLTINEHVYPNGGSLRPRSQTFASPNQMLNQMNNINMPNNLPVNMQLNVNSFNMNDMNNINNLNNLNNINNINNLNNNTNNSMNLTNINNLSMNSLQLALQQQKQQKPLNRTSSFSVISNNQPLLLDNIQESSISITSTHTNPLLGPTDTLLIINIPNDPHISNSSNFNKILKNFGLVKSVRQIKCCDCPDLVIVAEFMDVESAINCRSQLNSYELYPGLKCSISFAKILEINNNLSIEDFTKVQNFVLSENPKLELDTDTLKSLIDNSLNYKNIKANDLGPLPPILNHKQFDNPSL